MPSLDDRLSLLKKKRLSLKSRSYKSYKQSHENSTKGDNGVVSMERMFFIPYCKSSA